MINSLSLLALDLIRAKFTWSNGHSGEDLIQVKLVRGLISPDWLRLAFCKLNALACVGSDHFPIFLSVSPLFGRKAYRFRFEKMWLMAPKIQDKILESWSINNQGTTMFRIVNKLSNVKSNIQHWNKSTFGNIFKAKEKPKLELVEVQEHIQAYGFEIDVSNNEIDILTKLHDIISKEEEYWKQRSRALWIKSGEKNTKFFHMMTLKNRATNRINKIQIGQRWVDKHDEIF
ncbi:uncharacterized protein LOC131858781 [Cryptomeria japonica]|uniref:uncharacterized protein LOC131858781 n=1 Tax=Cryptomeria japonica TaxID=3369 RepID=UPI0027DA0544|nr:uncharacterized protein LOC131858781 [Cryptomeria japonica]